jgi:hypothetical protein
MRIYLATLATYYVMSQALTECDYEDRLLSYYLMRDYDDRALTEYIKTGVSWRVPKSRKKTWFKNKDSFVRVRRLALAKRLKAYEEGEADTT